LKQLSIASSAAPHDYIYPECSGQHFAWSRMKPWKQYPEGRMANQRRLLHGTDNDWCAAKKVLPFRRGAQIMRPSCLGGHIACGTQYVHSGAGFVSSTDSVGFHAVVPLGPTAFFVFLPGRREYIRKTEK
jgi:hypothetical protein